MNQTYTLVESEFITRVIDIDNMLSTVISAVLHGATYSVQIV